MMVINGAYRVLKESDLRIMYDSQRSRGLYGARSQVKGGKEGAPASSMKSSAASKPRPVANNNSPPPRPSSSSASSAGRSYSSDTYQDLFNDLFGRGDPDRRAAERAERERLQAAQEAYARRVEAQEANFRQKAREKLRSNVDSALDRLISQYWSMAAKKDELESKLLHDRRDWGAANLDPKDVQKRLEDLEEYRCIQKQVKSLEEEVAARVFPKPVHDVLNRFKNDVTSRTSSGSGRRYSWSRGSDDDNDDDYYSRSPPPSPTRRYYGNEGSSPQPQPQPQPQWQRPSTPPPPPKSQTYGEGSGGGGGYQTWQDEQRRRRNGYKGTDDYESTSYTSSSGYLDNEDEFDWFGDGNDNEIRQQKKSSPSQSSQVYRTQAKEVIRDFSLSNSKFSPLMTDNEVIEDIAALLKASDESRRFAKAAERINPYDLTDDDDFFTNGDYEDDLSDFSFEKEIASAILQILAARLRDRNR